MEEAERMQYRPDSLQQISFFLAGAFLRGFGFFTLGYIVDGNLQIVEDNTGVLVNVVNDITSHFVQIPGESLPVGNIDEDIDTVT